MKMTAQNRTVADKNNTLPSISIIDLILERSKLTKVQKKSFQQSV